MNTNELINEVQKLRTRLQHAKQYKHKYEK